MSMRGSLVSGSLDKKLGCPHAHICPPPTCPPTFWRTNKRIFDECDIMIMYVVVQFVVVLEFSPHIVEYLSSKYWAIKSE